jgi:hypothetical protein
MGPRTDPNRSERGVADLNKRNQQSPPPCFRCRTASRAAPWRPFAERRDLINGVVAIAITRSSRRISGSGSYVVSMTCRSPRALVGSHQRPRRNHTLDPVREAHGTEPPREPEAVFPAAPPSTGSRGVRKHWAPATARGKRQRGRGPGNRPVLSSHEGRRESRIHSRCRRPRGRLSPCAEVHWRSGSLATRSQGLHGEANRQGEQAPGALIMMTLQGGIYSVGRTAAGGLGHQADVLTAVPVLERHGSLGGAGQGTSKPWP